MISLRKVLLEGEENLPVPAPDSQVDAVDIDGSVSSDLDQIKRAFAEALDIDPETVEVTKLEKRSGEDYMDLSLSGDVAISCPEIQRIGAQRVADLLNGAGFLDDIEINGQSGTYLSAIVFESHRDNGVGVFAGGDMIITSKQTENIILPFLAQLGIDTSDCNDAFNHYWDGIGGIVIGQDDLSRVQQQLMARIQPLLMGARRGRGALGGGARRALGAGRRF